MQGVGNPQLYAGSWVEALNDAGISVAGHDMQGLGFSEGLHGRRGYFDSLDDVIADSIQFRRWHLPALSHRTARQTPLAGPPRHRG
jgi:Serine aminopeptidase, S33